MCDNPICKERDATKCSEKCTLCRQGKYCSDKCRQCNWMEHDCVNARFFLKSPSDTIFTPYDHENPEVQKERFLGVYYDHKNDVMVQKVVENCHIDAEAVAFNNSTETRIGRGKEPGPEMVQKGVFFIEVSAKESGKKVTLACAMPRDAIYLGNKNNKAANTLAKYRLFRKEGQDVVLWPDPRTSYKADKINKVDDYMFNMQDTLTVRVVGVKDAYVTGAYKLSTLIKRGNSIIDNAKNIFRSAKATLDPTLAAKFQDSTTKKMMYDPKYIVAAGAVDNHGHAARLLFLINEKDTSKARLIDVEFSMAEERYLEMEENETSSSSRGGGADDTVLKTSSGPLRLPPPVPERDDEDGSMSMQMDLTHLEDVSALVICQSHLDTHENMHDDNSRNASILRAHEEKLRQYRTMGKEYDEPISTEVDVAASELVGKLFGLRARKFFSDTMAQEKKVRVYKKYETAEEFQEEYERLMTQVAAEQAEGNSGGVTLQTARRLIDIARTKDIIVRDQKRFRELLEVSKTMKKK